VNSCWKINGHGISVVSETKVEEWETRLDTLFQQIQYWVDNTTDKTVEIVELFY
jgi:Holliday junction resolvasome RuvABC endonuclease subunit